MSKPPCRNNYTTLLDHSVLSFSLHMCWEREGLTQLLSAPYCWHEGAAFTFLRLFCLCHSSLRDKRIQGPIQWIKGIKKPTPAYERFELKNLWHVFDLKLAICSHIKRYIRSALINILCLCIAIFRWNLQYVLVCSSKHMQWDHIYSLTKRSWVSCLRQNMGLGVMQVWARNLPLPSIL